MTRTPKPQNMHALIVLEPQNESAYNRASMYFLESTETGWSRPSSHYVRMPDGSETRIENFVPNKLKVSIRQRRHPGAVSLMCDVVVDVQYDTLLSVDDLHAIHGTIRRIERTAKRMIGHAVLSLDWTVTDADKCDDATTRGIYGLALKALAVMASGMSCMTITIAQGDDSGSWDSYMNGTALGYMVTNLLNDPVYARMAARECGFTKHMSAKD